MKINENMKASDSCKIQLMVYHKTVFTSFPFLYFISCFGKCAFHNGHLPGCGDQNN